MMLLRSHSMISITLIRNKNYLTIRFILINVVLLGKKVRQSNSLYIELPLSLV